MRRSESCDRVSRSPFQAIYCGVQRQPNRLNFPYSNSDQATDHLLLKVPLNLSFERFKPAVLYLHPCFLTVLVVRYSADVAPTEAGLAKFVHGHQLVRLGDSHAALVHPVAVQYPVVIPTIFYNREKECRRHFLGTFRAQLAGKSSSHISSRSSQFGSICCVLIVTLIFSADSTEHTYRGRLSFLCEPVVRPMQWRFLPVF